jgi:hypothetical protein
MGTLESPSSLYPQCKSGIGKGLNCFYVLLGLMLHSLLGWYHVRGDVHPECRYPPPESVNTAM